MDGTNLGKKAISGKGGVFPPHRFVVLEGKKFKNQVFKTVGSARVEDHNATQSKTTIVTPNIMRIFRSPCQSMVRLQSPIVFFGCGWLKMVDRKSSSELGESRSFTLRKSLLSLVSPDGADGADLTKIVPALLLGPGALPLLGPESSPLGPVPATRSRAT